MHSDPAVRKYSQLEGSGKLALDYTGSEIHVRARFAFKSSGGGKAGVFLVKHFLLYKLRYAVCGIVSVK